MSRELAFGLRMLAIGLGLGVHVMALGTSQMDWRVPVSTWLVVGVYATTKILERAR